MSSLSRKIKRQAERQKGKRALQSLLDDTIKLDREFFEGKKVRFEQADGKKLSEAVLEIIRPHMGILKVDTLIAMSNLVYLGVGAWRVAATPEAERTDAMRRMIDTIPKIDNAMRPLVTEIACNMVQRKLLLFPDDKRVIVNFKVFDEGGNWRIAISALGDE